jgi:hypothetical protein
LQKWGIRTALNKKYNCHTEPLFKEHNILRLPDLCRLKVQTVIRKRIDNIGPVLLQEILRYHPLKNRQSHVIDTQRPDRKITNAMPNFIYPLIWKQSNIRDIGTSVTNFKNIQKKLLIGQYNLICRNPKCHTCKQ